MNSPTHRSSSFLTHRSLIMGMVMLGVMTVACSLGIARARNADAAAQTHAGTDGTRSVSPVCRIGIYDSRAVAVAYVRSSMNDQVMQDLVRQRDEARKAGDHRRVKELEARGEAMQVRKHMQGFSTAPIEDIMLQVRDRLPAVADAARVGVVTREADYHASDVEVVDVTDALVALFTPDEQTLKIIADLRTRKPVALEAIAKLPASE